MKIKLFTIGMFLSLIVLGNSNITSATNFNSGGTNDWSDQLYKMVHLTNTTDEWMYYLHPDSGGTGWSTSPELDWEHAEVMIGTNEFYSITPSNQITNNVNHPISFRTYWTTPESPLTLIVQKYGGWIIFCVFIVSMYLIDVVRLSVIRFTRSMNIRKHGWPPSYCDGDGDFRTYDEDD